MTGTPPEARTEYSRGSGPPRAAFDAGARGSGRRGGRGSGDAGTTAGDSITAVVAAVALIGALLLVVAEFTPLYTVHTASGAVPGRTISTGSHDADALLPIALLVLVLVYAVRVAGSRAALLAIGVMGVLALLITLLGDLPDAHATGLLGGGSARFVTASSRPSAGFYMETAGALLLLMACVCGLLLLGPPPRRARQDGRSPRQGLSGS
jgi:hypothetical protein